MNLSQAKLLQLDTQNQYDAAMASLNEVLGTANNTQYRLADDAAPPPAVATSAEEVIALSLRQRPDLLALQLSHEADVRFSHAQRDQLSADHLRAGSCRGHTCGIKPIFRSKLVRRGRGKYRRANL